MSDPNHMPVEPPVFALHDPISALGERYKRRFIAVAPNGGRRTTKDHPALPMTPETLAQTAKSCCAQGAAMIHMHVRDKEGKHLLDAEAYKLAMAHVERACGDNILIQITTEALGVYTPEVQRQIVYDVKPQAASLGFREFVQDQSSEAAFADLLKWMNENGIVGQIIIYDTDDLERAEKFMAKYDFALDQTSMLYVLGRYSTTPNGMMQLADFVGRKTTPLRDLMVCAFGQEEVAGVTAAATFGASVRVGFENNLFLPNGEVAQDNAALVKAAHTGLEAVGLSAGTAGELRQLWGLS